MAEFDPNNYFRNKLEGLNVQKSVSVAEAMRNKLKGLQDYQQAVANDNAYLEPDRSLGDVVNDAGVVAAKGTVGLPQAIAGLADIPTGGRVGKALEEIGYRPNETQEMLSGMYSEAQQEANRKVQTAEGFMGTLDAALDNPSVIATAVGESIPQMLGGAAVARGLMGIGAKAVGGAAGGIGPALPGVLARAVGEKTAPVVAGALGEGILGAGSAMSQIRGETEDGLTTGKQALAALGSGAGTAILGFAGGKLAQGLGLPDIDTMLASGSRVTPAGFLKAVVGAGITESVFEEMPQSAQEQMWQNFALDKPLTEGVGEASAMGLLTGLAMGGVGGVASGGTGVARNNAEAKQKEKANQQQAIVTGDLAGMDDPTNPNYNPSMAIAALSGNSKQDATTPEARAENLAKGEAIIVDLEKRRNALASNQPETIQARIAELKADLAQVPADDTGIRPLLVTSIADEEAALAEVMADPKAVTTGKQRLAELDRQLKASRDTFQNLSVAVQTPEYVAEQVAVISTPAAVTGDVEADALAVAKVETATKRVLSMAINAPELLEQSVVDSLVADKKNALTDPQRAFLRKFSDARIAANDLRDMGDVSKEVYQGSKDNKGMVTYRKEMASAFSRGDQKAADRSLAGLSTFAQGHANKAAVASEAKTAFDNDGKERRIVNTQGRWVAELGYWPTEKERKANGGLNIGRGATKLVAVTKFEANALGKTLAEMQAAYEVSFNKPATTVTTVTTGAKDVTDVPQQGSGTQVQPKAAAVQGDGKAGDAKVSASARPAVAPVRPANVVEAAGVTTVEDKTVGASGSTVSTKESVDTESAKSTETTKENQSTEEDTTESATNGTLLVLQEKAPEGTAYELKNLLAEYVKQSAGSTGAQSLRPLVVTKDMYSTFKGKVGDLSKFLVDKTMNDAQKKAVDHFFEYVGGSMDTIRAYLPAARTADARHYDVMQYLLNVDEKRGRDVDENVKVAIAHAAYTWAASEATSPWRKKKKDINGILGKDEEVRVHPQAFEKLSTAGLYDHTLADSLGASVLQSLGFKFSKDAPLDLEPRLRIALGAHAISLLEQTGLAKRTRVEIGEMQGWREYGLDQEALDKLHRDYPYEEQRDKYGKKINRYFEFFAVARDKEGELVSEVQGILDANRGTQSVLDKLFKTDPAQVFPSLEPITELSKSISGTVQQTPGVLHETLLKNQSRPRQLVEDMVFLLDSFDEAEQHALIGVVEVDQTVTHVRNLKGLQAKNDALKRELKNFQEWLSDEIDGGRMDMRTSFYLQFQAWKNQRVGIASTAVNPQSSKVVRQLIGSPEWVTQIDSTNTAQMDSFWLRVGEGLGVKTESDLNIPNVLNIQAMFASGVYADAVTALRKKDRTAEDRALILAAVAKGDGNLHSLAALNAVAQQANAKTEAGDNNPYTFVTSLMGEVDGVANGTMLQHVLLGAKYDATTLQAFAEHGGFYAQGDEEPTHYSEYRSNGGKDIYQTTGILVHQEAAHLQLMGGQVAEHLTTIWDIAGKIFDEEGEAVTSAGRKLVKDALNPLAFGSGLNSVVNGMAGKFLDAVYAGFEKLGKDGADQAQINEYVGKVNKLIKYKDQKLELNQPIQAYLSKSLSSSAEDSIVRAYSNSVGKAVKSVIKSEFATFLSSRDALNEAANYTHQLYAAVRDGVRKVYIEELLAKGELPLHSNGKRMGDLSANQEAELTKRVQSVFPTMRSVMSKNDKGNKTDLFIGSTDRSQSKDRLYNNETKFGKELGNGSKGVVMSGLVTNVTEPGVMMGSANTHSLDSNISHYVQSMMDVLNIHDAVGAGIDGLGKAAELINKATWDSLLDYSPLSEIHRSLSMVLKGISDNTEAFGVYPEVGENLKVALKAIEEKAGTDLTTYMSNLKQAAADADKTKFEMMANWAVVDQYAFEGGSYQVTDADRAAAQKKLDALEADLNSDEIAAVINVKELVNGNYPVTEATPVMDLAQADVVNSYTPVDEAQGAVTKEAEESVDAVEGLRLSRGRAAQLLQAMGLNENLGQQTRDSAAKVLEALVSGTAGLRETIKGALDRAQATDLALAIHGLTAGMTGQFWGTVGTPAIKSEPSVVKFFENNPKPTIKEVIGFLSQEFQAPGREAQLQLLRGLYKSVNPDLPVTYVTTMTPETLEKELVPSASRGWYVSEGEGVFVLSPEFQDSGLTAELLLHEIVHAAVDDVMQNPNRSTKPLIDELEALRQAALALVGTSAAATTYKAALSNLDEFVAWGMTNQGFQNEVLKKVEFKSTKKGLSLVKGWKAFIDTLSALLFGSDTSKNNGLAVLVQDVSALMNAVAQERKPKAVKKGVKKAMSMVAVVQKFTTVEIHRALNDGKTTPAFQNHLSNLLDGVVNSLHGPYGAFKQVLMKDQALTAMDVWLKSVNTGKAPFASEAVNSGLAMGEQQAYAMEQVEAVVRASLDSNEAHTTMVYRELYNLYTEAEKRLTVQDFHDGPWAGTTANEQAIAQAKYDFVFGLKQGPGNRSNYLARFAALGLAHEGFNKKLQFTTAVTTSGPKTLGDKLQSLFEQVLAFFRKKFTNTFEGQQADDKLKSLVGSLVDIEAKRRDMLAKRAVEKNSMKPIEDGVKSAFEGVRKKVVEAGTSDFVRNNGSNAVRVVGGLAKIVANDQVVAFMGTLSDMRDRHNAGAPGVVAGILNDVRGPLAKFNALIRAKSNRDRQRKAVMNTATKTVLAAFADAKTMKEKTKAGIAAVFLRTGAHVLLDTMDVQDITAVVSDRAELQKAIAATEAQLGTFGRYGQYFKNQANVLAYHLAVGHTKDMSMEMNAHNIVQMYDTPFHGKMTVAQNAEAEAIVDKLIALYALDYTNSAEMFAAKEVLLKENARNDGKNGVLFTLQLHKQLQEESLTKLFKGNRTQMMHGYTPDIYNPNIGAVVATMAEKQDLLDKGYKLITKVPNDPTDPDSEQKFLFTVKGGGLQPYLAGAISTKSEKAKGSLTHDGYTNVKTPEGAANAALQAQITNDPKRRAALAAMFRPGPRKDLSRIEGSFMAPVRNEQGTLVNWRYLMAAETKNVALDRNNDFDKILGVMAGSIYDKSTSREHNKDVLKALKEQQDMEIDLRPHAYIEVGPNSTDPEMRAIWNMLPKTTKEDVKALWGKAPMMVRKDSLDMIFGYRKLSAADMFLKDPADRNQFEELLVSMVEHLVPGHSKGVPLKIARAEQMWQELVREAKDIIVVKTGVVLLGNITSNFSLLWLQGVPVRDMIHHHLVAFKGATAYMRDTAELGRLRLLVDSDYTQTEKAAMLKQIARLEDALARNPVAELIAAGMMPSIVEDVAMDDDRYSYKSALVQKVEGMTSKLPASVVSGARTVYMAHDTKLYKALSQTTQLSDFVARYTLYQHLTGRKENALTKDAAIQEASDAFVNYDLPLHRQIQYTDDMGIMMFTKYILRIQRVLLKTAKDNPLRVMSLALFNNYLDLGPIVLDSAALFRIGNNPLNMGPLTLFGALDDLATVNAGAALLK